MVTAIVLIEAERAAIAKLGPALAESLPLVLADVLLRQSQKPLSEHSLLCRDSPYPHLHEDILRTYVRSVKDFEVCQTR